MESIKVLLAGFSGITLAGLRAILASDSAIEIVGDVANGAKAVRQLHEFTTKGVAVNVVLTETRTQEVDGVLATRLVKEEFPEIAVLVLAAHNNDANVIDAIQAGAGGYLFLQETTPDLLLESIHRVLGGSTQMSSSLLREAVRSLLENGRKTLAERTTEAAHLTVREVDVLRLMGNAETNKAIAAALSITEDTTKKHVQSIIRKLEARSRTHAAILAAQAGIIGTQVAPDEAAVSLGQ